MGMESRVWRLLPNQRRNRRRHLDVPHYLLLHVLRDAEHGGDGLDRTNLRRSVPLGQRILPCAIPKAVLVRDWMVCAAWVADFAGRHSVRCGPAI